MRRTIIITIILIQILFISSYVLAEEFSVTGKQTINNTGVSQLSCQTFTLSQPATIVSVTGNNGWNQCWWIEDSNTGTFYEFCETSYDEVEGFIPNDTTGVGKVIPAGSYKLFPGIYDGVSVATVTVTFSTGTAGNWSGTWTSTFNTMKLVQSGDIVTGTFEWKNGKISGTINGNTLSGTWSQEPTYQPPNDSGSFIFTLSSDGNSFTGLWGYGSEEPSHGWNGNR